MATEQFPVRNRWTEALQFTAEITCAPDASVSFKLGLAVKWAVASGANLSGANLSGADLSGADLSGANLSRAYLSGANLSGADLSGANLSGADLSGANLSRAYLSGANLSGADLSGANLSGAYLSGANLSRANLSGADLSGANLSRAYLSGADLSGAYLSGAYLSGANLSGANLSGANLSRAYLSVEAIRPFKADLWCTLLSLRSGSAEVAHLIAKLRAGEVDGSTYGQANECACLVGTLAQPRNVAGDALDHNADRPAERWFMMIRPGDKPAATGDDGKETGGGFAARMALEWTLELCTILGFDPEAVAEPEQAAA